VTKAAFCLLMSAAAGVGFIIGYYAGVIAVTTQ